MQPPNYETLTDELFAVKDFAIFTKLPLGAITKQITKNISFSIVAAC